jgi:hypothetical protein
MSAELVPELYEAVEPDYESEPPAGIDEHEAAHLLRTIGDIDARKARLERFAKEEIAIIEERLAQRVVTFDKARAWHLASLEEFARREIPRRREGKTLDLLCGEVKLVAPSSAGRLAVIDKDLFGAWAATATMPTDVPGVRIKFEADASALKSTSFTREPIDGEPAQFRLLLDGEVIPGIRLVFDTEDTFSYEVTR